MSTEMTLSELDELLGKEDSQHDLLIGNGLGKSYPDKYVRKAFEFDCEHLRDVLIEKIKEYSVSCPEEFLNEVRRDTKIEIIERYMKDIFQSDLLSLNCNKNILRKSKGVFTLNYDPILFFSLLSDIRNQKILSFLGIKKKCFYFNTGFHPQSYTDPITIDQVKTHYLYNNEINKNIYHLHGAFHIYRQFIEAGNEVEKYYRTKCSKEGIQEALQEYKNSQGDSATCEPLVILDARSDMKKFIVQDIPFLTYCNDKLKEGHSKMLVIFGCSFSKDAYLLETLKGSKYEKIYICVSPGCNKDMERLFLKYFPEERIKIVTIQEDETHFLWEKR